MIAHVGKNDIMIEKDKWNFKKGLMIWCYYTFNI